jgi:integrase/recombinase XerD
MSNQLVQNNPCFDYTKQLPRKENVSKSDAMTYEEVLRLLSVINKEEITGFTHYTGLSILFNLGLRVTEVCSLKLKHFYVNDNNEYVVDVKSKGGEIIPMPVNENLRFMIDRYVEFIENKYDVKFSPDSYLLNSMLCKCGRLNNSDEPPRRNWLNRVIKKYANLAGIEKRITSHSARISAINILLESGENLRGVRDFARHKTVRTTEGYERKLNGLKDNLAHKMKLF